MDIRPASPADRQPLAGLLGRIENFTPDEVACALELVDLALGGSRDYQLLVAAEGGQVLGYICFGPTPMTQATFDLYWIASDPAARGKGVGKGLIQGMEEEVRRRGGGLIRVETSATEAYGATRGFYAATRYTEEARIRDFYKPGDDLIILTKHL